MEQVQTQKLTGIIENITFYNPDNGFTVLELETETELITVVGNMPHLTAGETLSLMGHWVFHKTFGRQFSVTSLERSLPRSIHDILRYLSLGAIKGIGPATANRIVERFGADSLDIIENHPGLLATIKGISAAKAEKISEEYKLQFGIREVMLRLSRFGISNTEALTIYKALGSAAVEIIEKNPFVLCERGISFDFSRVDELSRTISPEADPLYRAGAGIQYVLRHNTFNGHTCLPEPKLIDTAAAFLELPKEEIRKALDASIEKQELTARQMGDTVFIFLPRLYSAENYAATRLKLMAQFNSETNVDVEAEICEIENRENIKYHALQRQAINEAVNKGVLVLTGGPGTGKTTTLNAIIKIFESHHKEIALAAPTGRAAKRLFEVCRKPAKTLHRLLEVTWSENDEPVFMKNEKNPLDLDVLIIDELSMVDVRLFEKVLLALPLSAKLILVGDSDQLPSIGAGAVLHDIIASGQLPAVSLKTVFRQAMKSLIVTNAHRIVKGEHPDLSVKDNDFFFLETHHKTVAAKTVKDLYCTRLPKTYQYNPLTDIQILCPSKKGELGTVSLNKILQETMNPPEMGKRELDFFSHALREGDKVMQIKNDYDTGWTNDLGETGSGVFNGDIGILENISPADGMITVRFEDRVASYSAESAKNLELAYAITIHKSQGSEYDCVLLPLLNPVPNLCYRNLLYTAVTRAKSKLIIVGSRQTVESMVDNNKKTLRYTALSEFLKQVNV